MNFMISCRQPLVFLKEASEIRVNYEDIERLQDFVTEDWTCTADIIIYLPREQIIDWNNIDSYKEVLNITIATEDTSEIPFIKNKGYKVFWSYPVSSFWELRSILKFDVDQVLLDAPLFFSLPEVKNICGEDVELRVIVNKCFNKYLPQENGVCGTYIRPEDIEVYSNFIEHFEFDSDNSIKKEYTLYKIYTKDKQWPGNLNLLLTNFNIDVDNRGFEVVIEEDKKAFAHRRINCKQKCQENSNCNYCMQIIKLINAIQKKAEEDKLKELKANKEE